MRDSEQHDAVYVVVTSTGTHVARAIRKLTKMPYSHASLAPDASLQILYSFCRTYRAFPLPANFNEERIGQGLFGQFPNIPCEIYEIPVTTEQYQQFQHNLTTFYQRRRRYSYSLLNLLWVRLQIVRELHYRFVCSQFVAYMLDACGVPLDKPASLYSPDDLRHIPNAKLIYRGELNQYYQEHNFARLLSVGYSVS